MVFIFRPHFFESSFTVVRPSLTSSTIYSFIDFSFYLERLLSCPPQQLHSLLSFVLPCFSLSAAANLFTYLLSLRFYCYVFIKKGSNLSWLASYSCISSQSIFLSFRCARQSLIQYSLIKAVPSSVQKLTIGSIGSHTILDLSLQQVRQLYKRQAINRKQTNDQPSKRVLLVQSKQENAFFVPCYLIKTTIAFPPIPLNSSQSSSLSSHSIKYSTHPPIFSSPSLIN